MRCRFSLCWCSCFYLSTVTLKISRLWIFLLLHPAPPPVLLEKNVKSRFSQHVGLIQQCIMTPAATAVHVPLPHPPRGLHGGGKEVFCPMFYFLQTFCPFTEQSYCVLDFTFLMNTLSHAWHFLYLLSFYFIVLHKRTGPFSYWLLSLYTAK